MYMVHKVNQIKKPIIRNHCTNLSCTVLYFICCHYSYKVIYSKKPEYSIPSVYSIGLWEPWGELVLITTKHQLIPLLTFNQKRGSNQWNRLLQCSAGMKTCRRVHSSAGHMTEYCCRVSAGLLVGVLSRLPSARYVAWWGHSMASETLGHFPFEEQQCFDLWESSLSTTCVRSCFSRLCACSHVFVFPKAL